MTTRKGETMSILKIRKGRYDNVQVRKGGTKGVGWTVVGKARHGGGDGKRARPQRTNR